MGRALNNRFLQPERRTAAQVEADINDEIDLHLALVEKDLLQAGLTPKDAALGARARFGDPAAVRLSCRAIALKERLMLQRISFAIIFVLVLTLAWVLYASTVQRRRAINSELHARLQAETAIAAQRDAVAAAQASAEAAAAAASSRPVYITGLVDRPGTYSIPGDGLSLRRLIIAAGGLKPEATRISVFKHTDGKNELRMGLTIDQLNDSAGPDLMLEPNDMLQVE